MSGYSRKFNFDVLAHCNLSNGEMVWKHRLIAIKDTMVYVDEYP